MRIIRRICLANVLCFLHFQGAAWGADIHWNNASGGNWSVAGNWLEGITPGANDTAIIELPGTYTVTLNLDAIVAGFTLNNANATFSAIGRTFSADNATIMSGSVLWQGSTWTGKGTLTNNGTFTVTLNSAIHPGLIQTGTIRITSASTGVEGRLTVSTGFTNAGTIRLENMPGFNQQLTLAVSFGTLRNQGVIELNGVNAAHRRIEAALDNTATGELRVNCKDGFLRKANASHVNDGVISIASGGKLDFDTGPATLTNHNDVQVMSGGSFVVTSGAGANFTNAGGTVTVDGAMTIGTGGTLQFNSGTLTGASTPLLTGGAALVFGNGAAVTGTVGARLSNSLTGDIPAGFTVIVTSASSGVEGRLTASMGFTNAGTIRLENAPTFNQSLIIAVTSGTLRNEGEIELNDTGASQRRIEAALHNTATGEVRVNCNDGFLSKASLSHVNDGVISIASGGKLDFDTGPATLTNHNDVQVMSGGSFVITSGAGANFTNAGGTVTVDGSMTIGTGGTLQFNSGTLTGASTPLLTGGAALVFGNGAAVTGTVGARLSNSLTGDIPAGFTVIVTSASSGVEGRLTASMGFTNAGTIRLENAPTFNQSLIIAVTSGTLRNEGEIELNDTGASQRRIEAALHNTATGEVRVNCNDGFLSKASLSHVNDGVISIASGGKLDFDTGPATLTNHNDVQVMSGGSFVITSGAGANFTNAGGTVTVDGSMTIGTGGTLQFNSGTLTGASTPLLTGGAALVFGNGAAVTGTVGARLSNSLTGDIPAGFTVIVTSASSGVEGRLTASMGFTNAGTIRLENAPGFNQDIILSVGLGPLRNEGTIILSDTTGAERWIEAELHNASGATVRINTDNGTLDKPGSAHVNDGTIDILAFRSLHIIGATLSDLGNTISGGGTLTLDDTTLFYGGGTLGANVVMTNSAALHPGLPPAEVSSILNITGDLIQDSGTVIHAAINGPLAGANYDQINVIGAATLNGTFNVVYAGDDAPCQGQSYTVLTKGGGATCFSGGMNITGLANPLNGFALSHNTCAGNQLVLSTVPEADCNDSCREDAMDVSGGFSTDCDWDGGGPNGNPDDCDIAGCVGTPACADCNTNIVPDGCDLADGTSDDVNENSVPDECDPEPMSPMPGDNTCQTPGADTGVACTTDIDCASPAVCGTKNRYLSITPGALGVAGDASTSIQIEITFMPQFPERVGEIWWAGVEQNVPNSPNPALRGAPLLCETSPSNAQVWTSGVLHLFGASIVPGAGYHVRMCYPNGTLCSFRRRVGTGKWGDTVRPFGGVSQPAFGDINEIVFKFRNLASAADIPRVDLVGTGNPGHPNMPNQAANFGDISADVEAFRGFAYPYAVPTCP